MAAHRSVSQLAKYASCSEQYRLSYVDKVLDFSPAAWLAQGTAFHLAVEGWEQAGRSELFDICQAYVVAYDAEIAAFRSRQPDLTRWSHSPRSKVEDDIQSRRERGEQQVKSYQLYAESNNFMIKDIDDFTLAIEVPFEVEIGGVVIKGAIDQILVDPLGVEVRDLKTGNREATYLQLGIYAFVVEKIFGWPVTRASYYYAKDSKIVTLSRKDLDRYSEEYLTSMFQSLETGIKEQVFIPNPGDGCLFCPVKDYCREKGSKPMPIGPKPPTYR
jgi:putative RecB family exonuclease